MTVFTSQNNEHSHIFMMTAPIYRAVMCTLLKKSDKETFKPRPATSEINKRHVCSACGAACGLFARAEQVRQKDVCIQNVLRLSAFDQKRNLRVVIETPRNSRNKFDYDPETGLFECHSSLPVGMLFPFDFGFITDTKAQDGDPLDVLVLMDEPSYPGTIVKAQLIGVLEAVQTERDGTAQGSIRVEARTRHHKCYRPLRSRGAVLAETTWENKSKRFSLRKISLVQGSFYIASGLWLLFSLVSFEQITGREKTNGSCKLWVF
jgi:hypothetical protein